MKAGNRGGLVEISGSRIFSDMIILEVWVSMTGGSLLRVKGESSTNAISDNVLPSRQHGALVQVLPGQVVEA